MVEGQNLVFLSLQVFALLFALVSAGNNHVFKDGEKVQHESKERKRTPACLLESAHVHSASLNKTLA